jgi:hypothetical protein
MTTIATAVQFQRPADLLWRDTGMHVVVLSEKSSSDIKVLGGGGAVVWRLLEQPATIADMLASLRCHGTELPTVDELDACLQDLLGQGLVTACEVS